MTDKERLAQYEKDQRRLAQIDKEIEREGITELELKCLEAEVRAIRSRQLLQTMQDMEALLQELTRNNGLKK